MSAHPFASRLKVLENLRRHEPTSRAELCKFTGLGHATVSGIVRDLITAGYVLEEKEVAIGRGRPRSILKSDPETFLVVGANVHVGSNKVDLQIANLLGQVLVSIAFDLAVPITPESLVRELAQNILIMLKQNEQLRRAPTIVAVSLPAMVDASRGILHWFPPCPPSAFPFAESLSALISLPVVVDNTCNVLARAERWFDEGVFKDDLCVVLVGPGLGLAQYVGGVLHVGAHGLNPEFGHVKTGVNVDRQCACGAKGCLVQTAGMVAMTHIANQTFGWSFNPLEQYDSAVAELARIAELGNSVAAAMLDNGAQALGVAISNHVALWDPSRVLIITSSPSWLHAAGANVVRYIKDNLPGPAWNACSIKFRLADHAVSQNGTTALALDKMISSTYATATRV